MCVWVKNRKTKGKVPTSPFTIATRSFSHSLRIWLVRRRQRRRWRRRSVCASAWVCKARVVVHIMLLGIVCHMLCPLYGWVSACGWVCVGANDWMKFLLLFALISHSLVVCVCVSDSLADWLIARTETGSRKEKLFTLCQCVVDRCVVRTDFYSILSLALFVEKTLLESSSSSSSGNSNQASQQEKY